MAEGQAKFVAYLRVSTNGQASSGLGLDAQRSAVRAFVAGRDGCLIAEFQEVESGRVRTRPELKRALEECARRGATLVIARLDRLARNLYVIASLMESRVEFVAADMPSASKLTIQLIAAIAEHERDQISRNTRLALREAKSRGVVLGNPRIAVARTRALCVIQEKADEFARRAFAYICSRGLRDSPLSRIAAELNKGGFPTQRGKQWTAMGVKNVVQRAEGCLAAASIQ